jgi:hypothetical protein
MKQILPLGDLWLQVSRPQGESQESNWVWYLLDPHDFQVTLTNHVWIYKLNVKKFLEQSVRKINMFLVISILPEWFILTYFFYCRDLICISPVRKPCFIKIVNDATTVALPKIEQVKNMISNVVFALLYPLVDDRTGEQFDCICRLYSAVALPKIKQLKNTFSNVVFSLLSHCQRLKCSFYFIVTFKSNRQKVLLKMSSFLYCSVGGR